MSQPGNDIDPKKKGEVSVWIINLSLFALPPLIGTFLRHGRYTVRFGSATRGGLILAWLLRIAGILASRAQWAEFANQGTRVDDSASRHLEVRVELPKEFADRLFSEHRAIFEKQIYPDSRVQKERVLAVLHNMAATVTQQLLQNVEAARYWQRAHQVPSRLLVMVSPAAVLANSIEAGWAGEDIEFRCPWSWRSSLLFRFGRDIQACLQRLPRPRRKPGLMPASVAAAVTWGLNRSERVDDLFWWWDSGISPDRVILFFDRRDINDAGQIIDTANQLGIQCVALEGGAPPDTENLVWRAAPGPVLALDRFRSSLRVHAWAVPRGPVGRWAACQMLDMLRNSQHIEDFISEFNVRALFHHQDGGLDHLSIACEATGTARIGHHWSHYPWPAAYIARMHQVYFAWGSHYAGMIQAEGPCVEHLLMSGCTIQGARTGEVLPQLLELRSSLSTQGASRILTLFDTSLPAEGFYEFFLQKVIEDTRWGLLIKRKNNLPLWERRNLPELKSLYERGVATGRVHMLEGRLSPIDAAAAADFSVGVDINSAIIVAALAGHRAIHLDYVRLHASHLSDWAHLYRAGPDRIVFDDPEKLWQRLNLYFDQPGSDPDLGVHDDALLRDIDPFRDGQAGQRIGEYLWWYLEGLDNGTGRDQALKQANRLFAGKWGGGAVVRGLEEDSVPANGAESGFRQADPELARARSGQ